MGDHEFGRARTIAERRRQRQDQDRQSEEGFAPNFDLDCDDCEPDPQETYWAEAKAETEAELEEDRRAIERSRDDGWPYQDEDPIDEGTICNPWTDD